MRKTIAMASIAFVLLLCSIDAQSEESWPMYGRSLRHTFTNADSQINPSSVLRLQPAWDFITEDVVTASPSVVDGVVYVGAWDGYFYALAAHSGALIWKFAVDCQSTIVPIPPRCPQPAETPPRFLSDGGLITSSAAVIGGRVYFAGGKTVYSLNARDGSLLWKRVICGNSEEQNCESDPNDRTRIFSSPAVFDGLIYLGHTIEVNGYRGGFEALDAQTGEIVWHFEVDPVLDEQVELVSNDRGRESQGQNRVCGNVWSSAAVDTKYRLVFFGTADCHDVAVPPYHNAVIALNADTGRLRWVFRPDRKGACDFDFGASPNLIDLGFGHYVGIGGKDGTYYLLDRLTFRPQGRLVWSARVVFGGNEGGFIGTTAVDGSEVFGATAIGDGHIINPNPADLCDPSNPKDTFLQDPSMHAFDLLGHRGRIAWQQGKNYSTAPTTVTNGVVFSGLLGINTIFGLNAYDERSGVLLKTFAMPGSVNSGATPVGRMLFVGSGTTPDGSGSGVHAFTLP
jgi:polyvinyl alcohol dehydrogenase (cytochrome)